MRYSVPRSMAWAVKYRCVSLGPVVGMQHYCMTYYVGVWTCARKPLSCVIFTDRRVCIDVVDVRCASLPPLCEGKLAGLAINGVNLEAHRDLVHVAVRSPIGIVCTTVWENLSNTRG